MSNREDALSLVCLIESAQYGLQFGDGSLRKGRALTTEEMRIIEKALYAYAVPVAAPSEQFEHLDLQNHQLRRAMQKMMARLTELLDEDKFAEVEAIANSAGVEPPIATQQQTEPAFVTVPVNPTPEMVRAGNSLSAARWNAESIYAAMVSASKTVHDCGCETNQPCAMKTDGSCWRAD